MMLSQVGSWCTKKHSLPLVCFLINGWMAICVCSAQTPATAPKQSTPSQVTSSGFSIETEMLTYRALESNSEAIACDVAGVLSGTKPDFSHPTDGAPCTMPANMPQATIVLLPFEKTELEEFTQWRAAMVEMAELQSKAASLGCPKGAAARAGTSTSSLSSFLSMSPAGPPLALAQSVLGLLESQETTISVGGNIQDLVFLNNVARQLMALRISVMMPSSYDPGIIMVSDETKSPFLASKERTLLARGCLTVLKPQDDQEAANIKQAIADIDDYMATFAGFKPVKTANSGSATHPGSAGGTGPPGSDLSGNTGETNSAEGAAANAASSLLAILRADGLAQKLGFRFDANTGKLSQPDSNRYILMLKALESGGSVTGRGNILGTKLRYSGGAVGTYALFTSDGDLACAGNVYDYGGSLSAKNFERDLRQLHFDPAQQVIFHTSGCPASGSVPPAVPVSNPIH